MKKKERGGHFRNFFILLSIFLSCFFFSPYKSQGEYIYIRIVKLNWFVRYLINVPAKKIPNPSFRLSKEAEDLCFSCLSASFRLLLRHHNEAKIIGLLKRFKAKFKWLFFQRDLPLRLPFFLEGKKKLFVTGWKIIIIIILNEIS